MTLRPFNGRSTTRRSSIRPDMVADVVSTSGTINGNLTLNGTDLESGVYAEVLVDGQRQTGLCLPLKPATSTS